MIPKIFVLFGSPRKNGYTARMLEYFFECWGGDDIKKHTVIFNAYDAGIKPCIHCGHCKKIRGCIYDDFIPVEQGLNTADILIVASPVYGLGFPSPLKAVFDRAQQYFEAKFSLGIGTPVSKHKAALFFASCGSADGSGAAMMKKQLLLEFRLFNAELLQTVVLRNTDNIDFDKGLIAAGMKGAARRVKRYLTSFLDEMKDTRRF
ncbi:MAG: flavodoxin family protein [Spirochaetaceae bacterium]|jgi:multimeric flavodoxin WrbA|nr:flavodoxin family protein [Spirochaetaceae bacterium]